ncbi:TFIIS N-terminal domain-containing protein [[Candida] zeylanoides]
MSDSADNVNPVGNEEEYHSENEQYNPDQVIETEQPPQENYELADSDDIVDPALQDDLAERPHTGEEVEAANEEIQEEEEDIFGIQAHKTAGGPSGVTKKKNVRKSKSVHSVPSQAASDDPGFVGLHEDEGIEYNRYEDPQAARRRLLEEKMDSAVKQKSTRRRKADEDDLERMQDDRIDDLKDRMIKAANLDVEKNSQGQIATEKLKMLSEVSAVLAKADLAISILDNNLLEAVRLWLEPLPDASMPAYQIQKELITALTSLPIKTDHLIASGIGKVLVFYQRSQRTEANLKRIVDNLIGDWTRPILNKSDSYKDRTIQFNEYNKSKYTNQLQSKRHQSGKKEEKTLYEQSAERRKRAAIPSARTTAYKIAPRVDPSLLRRQQMRTGGSGLRDERYRRLNQKLTTLGTKKKNVKKGGPSIEGRNLAM